MVKLKEDSALFESAEQGIQQQRIDQDNNYDKQYLNMASQSAYAEIDKTAEAGGIDGGIRGFYGDLTVDKVGRSWSNRQRRKNLEGSDRTQGPKEKPTLLMDKIRTKVAKALEASDTRLDTATSEAFKGLPNYTLNQKVLSATNQNTREAIFDIRKSTLHSVASAEVHLNFLRTLQTEIEEEWEEHVTLQNQLYTVVENSLGTKILKTAGNIAMVGGVGAAAVGAASTGIGALAGGTALAVLGKAGFLASAGALATEGIVAAGGATLRGITSAVAPSGKTQQKYLDKFSKFDGEFQNALTMEFAALTENLNAVKSKGIKGRDHMAQRVLSRFNTGTETEKDEIIEYIRKVLDPATPKVGNKPVDILGITSQQEKIHLLEALNTDALSEFRALISGQEFSHERYERQQKETEVCMQHIALSKQPFTDFVKPDNLKTREAFKEWKDLKLEEDTKVMEVPALVTLISQELQRLKPNNTYEKDWFGKLLEADYLNDYGKFIVLIQKLFQHEKILEGFDPSVRKAILLWFMAKDYELDPLVDDPEEQKEREEHKKDLEEITSQKGLLQKMVLMALEEDPEAIVKQWKEVQTLRNKYTGSKLTTLLGFFKEGDTELLSETQFDTLYTTLREQNEAATECNKTRAMLAKNVRTAEDNLKAVRGKVLKGAKEEATTIEKGEAEATKLEEARRELNEHKFDSKIEDPKSNAEFKAFESVLDADVTACLRDHYKEAKKGKEKEVNNSFADRLNRYIYERHHEEISQTYLERIAKQQQVEELLFKLPEGASVTVDYLEVGPLTEVQVPEDFNDKDISYTSTFSMPGEGGKAGAFSTYSPIETLKKAASSTPTETISKGKPEQKEFKVKKQSHKTGGRGTILENPDGTQIQIFADAVKPGEDGIQLWKNAMVYKGESRPGTKAVAFNMKIG